MHCSESGVHSHCYTKFSFGWCSFCTVTAHSNRSIKMNLLSISLPRVRVFMSSVGGVGGAAQVWQPPGMCGWLEPEATPQGMVCG